MPPSEELVTYKVNGIFAVICILSHDSYTALGIVVKAIYFPLHVQPPVELKQ